MRAAHKQLFVRLSVFPSAFVTEFRAVESIIAPSKLTQQRVVQLNQGTADLVALCTSQVQYGGLGPD